MKADAGGFGAVEVERRDCFPNVATQLVPGIALSEDALGQALGAVTAVRLLGHLKNEFAHNLNSKRLRSFEQTMTWSAPAMGNAKFLQQQQGYAAPGVKISRPLCAQPMAG